MIEQRLHRIAEYKTMALTLEVIENEPCLAPTWTKKETKYLGPPLEQMYFDFKYNDQIYTLHYEHYLGISIFVELSDENKNRTELDNLCKLIISKFADLQIKYLVPALKQCKDILVKIDSMFWANKIHLALQYLERKESSYAIAFISSWYGGMGSFNDLTISKINGHKVNWFNEKRIKNKFTILNGQIFDCTKLFYEAEKMHERLQN